MSSISLPNVLDQDEDGQVYLHGHRITLQDVIPHYQEGYSPEMIVATYPTLELALVHKVIAYYLENRAGVHR